MTSTTSPFLSDREQPLSLFSKDQLHFKHSFGGLIDYTSRSWVSYTVFDLHSETCPKGQLNGGEDLFSFNLLHQQILPAFLKFHTPAFMHPSASVANGGLFVVKVQPLYIKSWVPILE